MLIDCDTCAVRGVHCHDCVVRVFLTLPRSTSERRTPSGVIELDDTEHNALRTLIAAGLVPRCGSSPSRARPIRSGGSLK